MQTNSIYDLFVVRDDNLRIKKTSGIYVLFSDDKTPLYVGRSVNLRSRVKNHLTSNGNRSIYKHTGKFYFIGIIYHEDIASLNDKETEIIRLLKPALNSSKVDYSKDIDISTINEYEMLEAARCGHNIDIFNKCNSYANITGFCAFHDPNNFNFSWVLKGKFITTEMQRLLHENEYKKYRMYFYMNKTTFGKLLREKTYAEIDYIDNEVVLKFKRHFIIIDEVEVIRIELR